MRRLETIVIGGGPAGVAAACGLASARRDVLLIERSAAPHHKVCGEFLSIDTQAQLHRLGVDPTALGAVAIERVAVYAGSRSIGAALPFRALSLSRYRLDAGLLQRAADQGAELKRAVSARQAVRDGDHWIVHCDGGEAIQCQHLVIATGKWTLRGVDDARDASLVGLKMHLRLAPNAQRGLDGAVELTLLGGYYAGLEPIEGGIANLCLLLPREVVGRLPRGWAALRDHLVAAAPHLAERLAGAEPLWAKPLAVVCPGGGHLWRESEPRTYRVGDRLAHIPPFTGDGLAIALASGALAAEHIRRGQPPAAYQAAARRLAGRPVRLAALVSGLAKSRPGRTLLLGTSAHVPGLVGAIVRGTRLALTEQRL